MTADVADASERPSGGSTKEKETGHDRASIALSLLSVGGKDSRSPYRLHSCRFPSFTTQLSLSIGHKALGNGLDFLKLRFKGFDHLLGDIRCESVGNLCV